MYLHYRLQVKTFQGILAEEWEKMPLWIHGSKAKSWRTFGINLLTLVTYNASLYYNTFSIRIKWSSLQKEWVYLLLNVFTLSVQVKTFQSILVGEWEKMPLWIHGPGANPIKNFRVNLLIPFVTSNTLA